MHLNVALLGFGNVGRALADLLIAKQETLRTNYDLTIRVVGIQTGRHGTALDSNGLMLRTAVDAARYGSNLGALHRGPSVTDSEAFIDVSGADLIFETVPTNPTDGMPALKYARQILGRGIHLVTANKGPVAFGYKELRQIAADHGVGFFFESTVMDGGPVLAVGREGLPGAEVRRIRGIFNSTTNYILTRMEQEKLSFEAALAAAQEIGIAETDPTLDIDGWDSSIKTVILANVLMGSDLRPADVDRSGIREITLSDVQETAKQGKRMRLLCEAWLDEAGTVTARVRPERVPANSVLASITGTTSIVNFETDVLPRLTLIEHDPGPQTTAYGMLADMINVVRGRFESRAG